VVPEAGIRLVYIQPGKPMQNGYVEHCNGSARKELAQNFMPFSQNLLSVLNTFGVVVFRKDFILLG
jgi:hypothetical protein